MDRKIVNTKDPLVQKVIERIAKRSDAGIKKFNSKGVLQFSTPGTVSKLFKLHQGLFK